MKTRSSWYSPRVERQVQVVRWGHYGRPVLLFSTAGGDAEEAERFLMVQVLADLLAAGRIKLYACDSVAGRAWTGGESTPLGRARLQNRFDEFVYHELVPAIRQDSGGYDEDIVVAGASVGAFNAAATLCRHPDVFRRAICMSGTYDLSRWMDGEWSEDFYFSSPLHFLPNLEDESLLAELRRCFVILAMGEGRWEDPEESWRLASVLGSKGIPNRVDSWGPEYDHDWPTWREMLPRYLEEVL